MKYGILIGMLLFLTACQHPTVYVYTEGLTALQKQQLTEQLQQQTLPFQFTELPVPKEFSAATLLTSEDKILITETEQLADIMQAMGYQPQINYVSVANHHYSDGNIGFYLRGEQIEQGFEMPQQMRTTGCVEDRYNNLKVKFVDNLVQFSLPNNAHSEGPQWLNCSLQVV